MHASECLFLFASVSLPPPHYMVTLEYPYDWKLSHHIWQLCTLGMGKFFHMLKFDLYQGQMIKKYLGGTPTRHRCSAKCTNHRGL